MLVVRIALQEYSRARPYQHLILTPRTKLDRQIVAKYGATLHLADSAKATIPTRVSVRRVAFHGDTVADVFIDNKAEGRTCYLLHRTALGRIAGSTTWVKLLGAEEEHVCNP